MKFHFGKLNAILFIVGILFLIVGYIIMGTGDKTISPIMLVIAYAVIFPLSLLIGFKKDK
jgi:multisubunit Na+/H+ antiporter MnhB subunit